MSGSKRKKQPPTSKRSPQRSRDVERAGGRDPQDPHSEKRHLSPAAACLITLPVVIAFAGIAWYVLSQGQGSVDLPPDLAQATPDPVAATDRTATPSPAATAGQEEASGNKVWETIADQEERWNEMDNAAQDGWDTEVISDRVTAQWNKLKKLLNSDKTIDAAAVHSVIDDDVIVHSVLPRQLQTVFQNDRMTVQRIVTEAVEPSTSGTGGGDLANALLEMLEPYTDRENLRLKWKVFRVNPDQQQVTTQQTLEVFGKTATGYREENATWVCDWTNEDKPHLKSVRVTHYESVDVAQHQLFADCTESILGANPSFHEQLLRGFDYWLERRQANSSFFLLANNGVAVGDVNGDGLEDLYLCQESGLPNLLYLQNPDGTLRDVSAQSGVNWLQNSLSALIVDLNNDGHMDLAVAVGGAVVIAQGNSTGQFEVRDLLDATDEIWSLTAADYDRDGRLDLHTGTYTPTGIASVAANVVLTMADFADGGINKLFHNESQGETFAFRDVTEECGLNVNNRRKTYSAVWEDLDNDGDLDLYVANDFGWNSLYRNDTTDDGKTVFVDIAAAADALDDSFGMSVNYADYDRDGWLDIYISNMYSYAGNRITYQDQFKADSTDNVKKRFQRFARGNTLLRNAGPSTDEEAGSIIKFEDRSMEAGVNMGRWAWSSCFLDVNNDGWEDLFVNNGYITASDSGDL